ncbi:MAG: transposase [Ectothiorhodospiraceae bacterium]|nr:transposase [Ectothiorhodospiraceae bacterium]
MERSVLQNDQWEAVKDLLPGKSTDCGVTAVNNRQFIEVVLWIARTGAPWRNLPEKLGRWHRVYVRYNR